jgi:cytochrome c-type biogenesis protein
MLGEQLFMSTVFIAGFLSFFAPCTFPLIPVYIGMLTDKEGKGRWAPVAKTMLFVGGLSTSFIILGFGAGALGSVINGRAFITTAGFIVIILGLHQMGLFHVKGLEKYKVLRFNRTQKGDYISTYLLGITFSFGWTPCVGPVLGAVLVLSAGGGQPLYGVWMMMIYALGLAIPFLVMAFLSNVLLERFEKLEKHAPKIKKFGGAMIVLMGVLLMTENIMVFTRFFENLL